jgi:hypothetical protein
MRGTCTATPAEPNGLSHSSLEGYDRRVATRALLVIADIGGYTRFMRLHRLSLAHAQENTLRLLEAMIDAAPQLVLSEIEGDAAFLYATEPDVDELSHSVFSITAEMHEAFHAEQARLEALRICICDACKQTGLLRVKVVAHIGDVAATEIRGRTTLAGPDVILVHRMLKNSVPADEYMLVSAAVLDRCDPTIATRAREIEEDLEGLGTHRLWFVDIAESAADAASPAPPSVSWLQRAGHATALIARGVPYHVGLKQSKVGVER